ncbi:hypothetical protein [Janthinobacterium sp. GW460W]|uniref:hypothetical protein n=2 Tax=Janthinobacterium TaxID=29580 RepID=UPI001C0DE96F|nr:hypothetical protein [Janthinobacterium sp. GW460W]MCC7708306.1 hypothetical protein [Janthinobacterium sp. GW460W]
MNGRSMAVTLVLACAAGMAGAQALPPQAQLPVWATQQLDSLAKREAIEVNARVNPFVLRGDFDGDGKGDLAILIKNKDSKKEGIVFLFRQKTAPLIVGAGHALSSGGDDFAWLEVWQVEDKGSRQHSYHEKSLSLKTDGIVVAKEGSASALIYIKSGKAAWQQQGD